MGGSPGERYAIERFLLEKNGSAEAIALSDTVMGRAGSNGVAVELVAAGIKFDPKSCDSHWIDNLKAKKCHNEQCADNECWE